jgi:hypothetical protein
LVVQCTAPQALLTTNLPECLFVEKRGRLKINPNAFAESAVLKLMSAGPSAPPDGGASQSQNIQQFGT